MVEDTITPEERASISARLVLLAPPCEFNEVFEDVRVISGDHPTTQKKLAAATAQYNRDQMIPVKLPNAEYSSLITVHGDLGNGQFLCPRLHSTFHYDHLKQTASDIRCLDPNDADGGDTTAEPWRHALEVAITEYTLEHFPSGSVAVYAPAVTNEDRRLVACIVSQFRKHQSTGRWRSEWTIKIPDEPIGGTFSVHGVIKVQTHLYEEGNVQLISSKEVDFSVTAPNAKAFANECVRHIKNDEIAYQTAVGDNFKTMSDTTFKALRRQLPVTRSKIDWNKIITYQIGGELSRAS
ncbi:hypothetical protein CRM22_002886 [Opisthorchis felineus]|uniref:F-actin-capping protein subunit alpha n=1 Tax=Opisthorchis felineus TaxID=147828 RepID=A0A4S2M9X7_OPIFE|nr:hypothetical protein CRM22_002886 [Opisthorchis felineus]